MYVWDEVQRHLNRNKGPLSSRKYVLGSGTESKGVRWWARYHSKCIFGCFRWFAILVRPSDTMYDLETIVGCVPSLLALTQCHSDHFRPHMTHFDLFRCFYAIFNVCLLILDWLLHRQTSYVFPILWYTYLMHSQPFLTFSDLLLSLFIFTVIDIPMFWLFIVSLDCTIAIGSDFDPYGLLVISDPSDAILTSPRLFLLIFYLPFPFYTEEHCTSFPRLRKTSHHLDLTQTAFYCVIRHYHS